MTGFSPIGKLNKIIKSISLHVHFVMGKESSGGKEQSGNEEA
ncbi:hypothetical protein [Bartonella quintana]|nr:hypothetical protein [Bartonella quintana]